MKVILTESQYRKLIKEDTQLEYTSEFLDDVTVVVVFEEDPLYEQVKEYFEEYIYLFTPGQGWEVREYGVGYWADLDKALNNKMITQSIIKN